MHKIQNFSSGRNLLFSHWSLRPPSATFAIEVVYDGLKRVVDLTRVPVRKIPKTDIERQRAEALARSQCLAALEARSQ